MQVRLFSSRKGPTTLSPTQALPPAGFQKLGLLGRLSCVVQASKTKHFCSSSRSTRHGVLDFPPRRQASWMAGAILAYNGSIYLLALDRRLGEQIKPKIVSKLLKQVPRMRPACEIPAKLPTTLLCLENCMDSWTSPVWIVATSPVLSDHQSSPTTKFSVAVLELYSSLGDRRSSNDSLSREDEKYGDPI
ncbi:hypothetical protein ARMGADRAFT_148428 [Armillaria gallica]|uniref:Uncharacterized protein n=1 Tax=Armillaria gallica TaxID=47427 RepID=A0A2H3DNT0_ARMGA|nr:hypothetical protein ARMGADRAFT_148428 [Armillaria gallica]